MSNILSEIRQSIRHSVLKKRHALTTEQQQSAAYAMTQSAYRYIQQHHAKHIALYHSFGSEISTHLLIQTLLTNNYAVYLPVLHPFAKGHLLFLQYQQHTPLKKNRFGILEPHLDVRAICPLAQLDIIFVPLVAFDSNGNRLGMGGGFYDRTLANQQHSHFSTIGLAHRCQEVENLPVENWDIPLTKIITG